MVIRALEPLVQSPAPAKRKLFYRRAAAYLLDLTFIYAFTVTTMIGFVSLYVHIRLDGDLTQLPMVVNHPQTKFIARLANALYYFSYFTLAHWYFGQTFGKWWFRLQTRNQDGSGMTFLRSLARSFSYLLSGQLTLGIGFLIALFRKDGKTLHDLLTTTCVIDTRPQLVALPAPSERQAA